MRKIIMIGSLVVSLILYLSFLIAGEGSVLAYLLVGLLVSFICAMLLLVDK